MNNYLCYSCGKIPFDGELPIVFPKQEEARKRFEEKNMDWLGINCAKGKVLGLCADCASKMNYKAKKNTIAKYGGNTMIDEDKVMSPIERKGRLLFKAVGLLERIIIQIEKLPEK